MARKEANPDQRYPCDIPGCNKSYSRPDHLLRHKLNHEVDRVLACTQCDRTFVRQDLLVRHLERHALRGKTLGRWSNKTRDKDSAGGSKGSGAGRQSRSRHQASVEANDGDEDEDDEDEDDKDQHDNDQSRFLGGVGESTSSAWGASGSGVQLGQAQSFTSPTMYPEQSPGGGTNWPSAGSPRKAHFAPQHYRNGSTDVPPIMPGSPPGSIYPGSGYGAGSGSVNGLPQSTSPDIYPSPHAALEGSFSRPPPQEGEGNDGGSANDGYSAFHRPSLWNEETAATSADRSSYKWVPPDEGGGGSYAPPPSGAYYAGWPDAPGIANASESGEQGVDGPGTAPAQHLSAPPAVAAPVAAHQSSRQATFGHQSLPGQDIFPFAPPSMDHAAEYGWLFDGIDPFATSGGFPGMGSRMASRGQSQTSGFSPCSSDGVGPAVGGGQNFMGLGMGGNGAGTSRGRASDTYSLGRGTSHDGTLLSTDGVEQPNALEDLAYFASLQAEIPNRATFHVDVVAHHRLLYFLQSVSELPSSPLFTPSALRCYIYLFFVKFNRIYPLIHEPTFVASATDPMLLSAVIVVGAHFAGLPAHEMAVRIAQKIWGAIVSLEDFRPARATLPMLQAMLLTECFGKMMSTRPQHEMAHLFHNFIITLARRNAVFNATTVTLPGSEDSEEHWRAWAREEEKKRIALFAFVLDAQHATIFRQIPALSAFQIQLHLPCSDEEWSKLSPESWNAHRKRPNYRSPSLFIPALKACIMPGNVSTDVDIFSRFVLLHGLMSIAYDLQWKQNVLLGAEGGSGGSQSGSANGTPAAESGIADWKNRLSSAYASWKSRLDIACLSVTSPTAQTIYKASQGLNVAAQIALFADTVDIQIYAGLPSVLGRFIDRSTFNASRKAIKEWARTKDGRVATWYAVHFLRSSLFGPTANGAPRLGKGATVPDDSHVTLPALNRSEGGMDGRANSPLAALSGALPEPRKNVERDAGLDEVLHHRWCQYLSALVIWAYGHALTPPRQSQSSANPSGGAQTNGNAATLPGGSTATPSSHILPHPTGFNPYQQTSRPPSEAQALDYLDKMSTRSPEDLEKIEIRSYTKGVLELVEKELRGSRWELGREASGVLRKLIQNHLCPGPLSNSGNGSGAPNPAPTSGSGNLGSNGHGGGDGDGRGNHGNGTKSNGGGSGDKSGLRKGNGRLSSLEDRSANHDDSVLREGPAPAAAAVSSTAVTKGEERNENEKQPMMMMELVGEESKPPAKPATGAALTTDAISWDKGGDDGGTMTKDLEEAKVATNTIHPSTTSISNVENATQRQRHHHHHHHSRRQNPHRNQGRKVEIA
ncbi:hypothetical protein IE53DRAFT_382635 [Violaceomyces palustris]|uniref:Uncharacterized protein n=1 Tax=Violaceomyces palustris TaxID=1673888 RepID=A0ACD0NLR9_9BASI|nr:hypothetical protein IE53DRAFT_382635 [Violaceomyces palustris]